MANFILSDNSAKLGTARRSDGKVGRLRIEWNTMRKSVGFSGQTQGGDWVNAYLMFSEFVTLCDDLKLLLNCKEERFYDCAVMEGKDAHFAFRCGVGRNSDGILYLEIAQPQKEALRFIFMPEKQFKRTMNGEPLAANELSRRRASAWLQTVLPAITKDADLDSPAEKGSFNKGNGGGGYQKKPWQGGNNNNGGYQKKPWQGGNNNNYNNGNSNTNNYGNNNNSGAPVADGSLDDYLTI